VAGGRTVQGEEGRGYAGDTYACVYVWVVWCVAATRCLSRETLHNVVLHAAPPPPPRVTCVRSVRGVGSGEVDWAVGINWCQQTGLRQSTVC